MTDHFTPSLNFIRISRLNEQIENINYPACA